MLTRDDYVRMLKSAALSAGKRGVMHSLVTRFPFIAGSIVNPIVAFGVGMVLELALNETELGAFFGFIDLRGSIQGRAFEKAALNNLEAQKDGTPEEKKYAEDELISRFRALAKFTN